MPTSVEREIVASPSMITDTSVEVPPMSKASSFGKPERRDSIMVLVTPPAGPDSTVWTGRSEAADALIRPPSERTICSRAVTPSCLQAVLDAREIAPHDGPDIVVHHRGDGAVVFAELRQDVG